MLELEQDTFLCLEYITINLNLFHTVAFWLCFSNCCILDGTLEEREEDRLMVSICLARAWTVTNKD